jgi:alpha-methylacyl-CoA racemase
MTEPSPTFAAGGRGAPIGPLRGVRVLDLTRFPPGAYCTSALADLGADVIRVESSSAVGKRSLVVGQVGLARAKRSFALDLRHDRGPEVLLRVCGSVDVLVENDLPGALEGRGYGFSQASTANPRLIWCSITGFGQTGPYAQWPGHDLTYLAHSGLLAALEPDLPWSPRWMLAVPMGAMTATTAIAAALFERTTTGRGCRLDISLAEAATWSLGGLDGSMADVPISVPADPGRTMYRCAGDTWITVAAAEPRTWAALCAGLGLTHLPDSSSPNAAADLGLAFATRPAREWIDLFGPLGAAVGPVNVASEVARDPHSAARGSTVQVAGVTVPVNPMRMYDVGGVPTTTTATSEPPTVGEHTDAVLVEAGYTTDEIAELRAIGVI